MLAIRLPEEIESRLEALAKKTGRTKTYYARQAILEYMDDLGRSGQIGSVLYFIVFGEIGVRVTTRPSGRCAA